MRAFAALYEDLDASTAQNDKLAALVRYFTQASGDDAAWAVTLLSGGKPRQLLPMAVLREAACRMAGVDTAARVHRSAGPPASRPIASR